MSPEFLLTTLIVVASPGTGVVVTLAAGLSSGWRGALAAAFGCTLGIIPHMIAAITGLATLLHTSPLAFEIVKYAGIAYLLWMAWTSLKADGPLQIDENARSPGALRLIVNAVALNLLNPKLPLFFVAFLPQFIAPDSADALSQLLQLSGVFMAMTFVIFAIYGVFAASLRQKLVQQPSIMRWLRRGFAAAFVGLGAKLAGSSL